jgi:hypothetical protein
MAVISPGSAPPSRAGRSRSTSARVALGTVAAEPEANGRGARTIWLDPLVLNRLRATRGPGESYSGVILRLAADLH